jgi:lipopolysaccharide/colanic/teichoic acid biosynthesis glycosyltransferase
MVLITVPHVRRIHRLKPRERRFLGEACAVYTVFTMPFARRETALLVFGDALLLIASLWLALVLRSFDVPTGGYFLEHLRAFIVVYGISFLIFFIAGLYEPQTRLVKRILGVRILGAQATNTAIAAVLFFLLPFEIAPKTVLLLYLVISVILISAWRFFIVPYLSIAETKPAVLIGEGDAYEEVLAALKGNSKYYVRFVDSIRPSTLMEGDLKPMLEQHVNAGIRVVVLDTRNAVVRKELPSLYDAMLEGVTFVEFSTFYEGLTDRVPLAHIDHAWLLEHLRRQNRIYAVAKRVIDIAGALIGIILSAPFIVIGILGVLLSGPGKIFVVHVRVGRDNKVFRLYKLRSMLFDDHGDAELHKKNRVTVFGKFLRKSRIDELPQLWNILIGDLSFIGPRPEFPTSAAIYETEIPYYAVRHLVTPGLSGWAQIYDHDAPRGGADVARTARKLSYDIYYMKHRSFGLDMAIALKTLRALASLSGT